MPIGVYNVYNVKDYGAVGNGTTDDSAAIQSAINDAGTTGGEVGFPPATYRTTATLTVPAKVTLRGSSTYRYGVASMISYTGTGTAIQFTGDHVSLVGMSLFTLSGATGVDTNGKVSLTLSGCNIQGFSSRAVYSPGSFWVRLHNVHVQNSSSGGDGIVATEAFNQWVIDTCGFTCVDGQSWTAIDIATTGPLISTGSSIVNCDFTSGGTAKVLIRVRASVHGLWVAGNRSESVGATFLQQDDNAFGITIIGNQLAGATSIPAAPLIAVSGGDTMISGNTFFNASPVVKIFPIGRRVFVGPNMYHASVGTQIENGSADNITVVQPNSVVALAGSAFSGGYRSYLPSYKQTPTVPASQNGVVLTETAPPAKGRPMPRSGFISALAINVSTARSAGTLTVKAQKSTNGGASFAPITGAEVVLNTNVKGKQATFVRGAYPFNAGDMVRLTVTTDAAWAPTNNSLDALLEIET